MNVKSTSVAGVAILVVVMAVGAVALGSAGSSSAAAPAGPRALPACHVLPGRTRCAALPGRWMRGRISVAGKTMVVVDPDRRSRPVTLATITGNPVAWSSDGSELLISDVPRLKVLGIGGGERVVARDANFGGASFTPDGRKVVYVDRHSVIREVSIHAGTSRAITRPGSTPKGAVGPALSPDGSTIAFQRWVRAQHSIWVMNANGTGAQVLVTAAQLNRLSGKLPVDEMTDVCWSPDGSRLAFAASTGNAFQSSVFTVNADGTELRRLTPPAARMWGASWSPDGKRIASMSGGREVITIRADGTHIRDLGYRSLTWGPLAWNPTLPVMMPPHR